MWASMKGLRPQATLLRNYTGTFHEDINTPTYILTSCPASWQSRILNDPTLAHIVTWGPRGDCLVVKDAHEFTNNILPGTFKHSNLASFVRQLNKYDFHKVRVCYLDLCSFDFIQSAIRSRMRMIPSPESVYVFFCSLTSDMITCRFRLTYFDIPTSTPADGTH